MSSRRTYWNQKRSNNNGYNRYGGEDRNWKSNNRDTKISKTLSYLLRHGAWKEGLEMREDGFVKILDILQTRSISQLGVTEDDINRIVDNDEKQRYKVKMILDDEYIRANQGHTLEIQVEMKKVYDIEDIPTGVAIHGTYFEAIESIMRTGLSRMKRQHIHFAMGEIQNGHVISGMRKNIEVKIYLDIPKLLESGIELFISDNNVILSPGNEEGMIPPEYFEKVINAKTGKPLVL